MACGQPHTGHHPQGLAVVSPGHLESKSIAKRKPALLCQALVGGQGHTEAKGTQLGQTPALGLARPGGTLHPPGPGWAMSTDTSVTLEVRPLETVTAGTVPRAWQRRPPVSTG